MHMAQGVQHRKQIGHDVLRAQRWRAALDRLQKVVALNEIHRHVGGLIVFEDLMHLDDVRMVQLRQRHRLLHEMTHSRPEVIDLRP